MSKRLLVISDLHCGSITGLTPPKWHSTDIHRECWKQYTEIINQLKPIDILVVNGDLINGSRAGDVDILSADPYVQQDMAAECIDIIDANKIFITAGTDAHSGFEKAALELERQVVDKIKVKALNRNKRYNETDIMYDIFYNLSVENVRFNFRHFTGSKANYAARSSTGSNDALWSIIRSKLDGEKDCDIIVRSHVHYFCQVDNVHHFIVITPSLQLPGSRYALKKCNGLVHWGMVYFDVEDGKFSFGKEIRKITGTEITEYNV